MSPATYGFVGAGLSQGVFTVLSPLSVLIMYAYCLLIHLFIPEASFESLVEKEFKWQDNKVIKTWIRGRSRENKKEVIVGVFVNNIKTWTKIKK